MFLWLKLVIWSCGWGRLNHQWSEPVVIPFFVEASTHPTPIVFTVWSSQFCFAGVVKSVPCESFFQTTGNSTSHWCSCPTACFENVAHSLCVMCTPQSPYYTARKKKKAWVTSMSFQFQVCFQTPIFVLWSLLFPLTHCFISFNEWPLSPPPPRPAILSMAWAIVNPSSSESRHHLIIPPFPFTT